MTNLRNMSIHKNAYKRIFGDDPRNDEAYLALTNHCVDGYVKIFKTRHLRDKKAYCFADGSRLEVNYYTGVAVARAGNKYYTDIWKE